MELDKSIKYKGSLSNSKISGHEGPLHRCDFSSSTEAGAALAEMLKLGASRPWQDTLESFTGERELNPAPLLRFFDPLYQYLKQTNFNNGDTPGWQSNSREMSNITI